MAAINSRINIISAKSSRSRSSVLSCVELLINRKVGQKEGKIWILKLKSFKNDDVDQGFRKWKFGSHLLLDFGL
jgi:hypothetical protein